MNLCSEIQNFKITSKKRNAFQLDLGYKTIDFTFCQLLLFRNKVLDKSSPAALIEILDNENFILLFAADNKHLIYLDIPQLLELRDLMLNVFKSETKDILLA